MTAPLRFPARVAVAFVLVGGALAATVIAGQTRTPVERAVRGVLDAQAAAWNRGDIDAFMEGYDRSDATRFASGGSVVRGWQTVRDRYAARYPSKEKMGRLSFSELEISPAGEAAAVVFGRWRLDFDGAPSVGGLFTLVFERKRAGWRIVADHTSSE
jgi:ketosteroid isomerase-like protein